MMQAPNANRDVGGIANPCNFKCNRHCFGLLFLLFEEPHYKARRVV